MVRGKDLGSFYLKGFLFCASGLLASNFLELSDSDPARIMFFSHIAYVFIAFSPVFWFIFSFQIGMDAHRKNYRALFASLSIVPALTSIFAFNDARLGFLWSSSSIRSVGELRINIVDSYGFWFLVHCAYSYGLYLLGAMLILKQLFGNLELYRRQSVLIFIATSLPFAFNIVYVSHAVPGLDKDLSPIVLAATGMLFTICITKYRMLELPPPSIERVIGGIDDGIVIVDERSRLVYYNDAAARLSDAPKSATMLGATLSAVFSFLPEERVDWEAAAKGVFRVIAHDSKGDRAVSVSVEEAAPGASGVRRFSVMLQRVPSTATVDCDALLTRRELEIARLLADDIPLKEIAVRTFISINTVKSHIRHIYKKLQIKNRIQIKEFISRCMEVRE
jgi:DNA-binding CsgD family transcriptional regulator